MGTHRASPMAVHSEVRAEEEVSDGQEQRLGQGSGSIIIIQLISLEKMDTCMRLDPDDQHYSVSFIERYCVNGKSCCKGLSEMSQYS